MKDFLPEINKAVAAEREKLTAVSEYILNHPETGHHEVTAAAAQCEYLEKAGFRVTREFGGLKTAYSAEAGTGKPVIVIFSEYDALPGIGHACGHHLITLSALAAAVAVKALIEKEKLSGTVRLVGSPAEEALGGKIDLMRAGVLNDMDFALITHPFYTTNVDPGNLAVGRYDVIYHGKAAHAAVSPELGVNALDAQVLLFNAIGLWRQQMPQGARVHGTITKGGEMPNIIPDYTSSFFYVRSLDNATQKQMEARFEQIAQGAALMTGCRLELNKYPNSYSANRHVKSLEELARKTAAAAGFTLGEITQKISTDFADVSLRCPGVNLMFDAVGGGNVAALHSQDFLECAKKPFAFEQAFRAGAAVALTALAILSDPATAKNISGEFAGNF